jgi:hypothetical protein
MGVGRDCDLTYFDARFSSFVGVHDREVLSWCRPSTTDILSPSVMDSRPIVIEMIRCILNVLCISHVCTPMRHTIRGKRGRCEAKLMRKRGVPVPAWKTQRSRLVHVGKYIVHDEMIIYRYSCIVERVACEKSAAGSRRRSRHTKRD